MKIITAKKFCQEKFKEIDPTTSWIDFNERVMIEFAKLHVEAALKAKGQAMIEKSYEDSSFSVSELDAFTEDSYPLENIK